MSATRGVARAGKTNELKVTETVFQSGRVLLHRAGWEAGWCCRQQRERKRKGQHPRMEEVPFRLSPSACQPAPGRISRDEHAGTTKAKKNRRKERELPLGINKRSSCCSEEETGRVRPQRPTLDCSIRRYPHRLQHILFRHLVRISEVRTSYFRSNERDRFTDALGPAFSSVPPKQPACFVPGLLPSTLPPGPSTASGLAISPRVDRSPFLCLQLS